MRGTRVLLAVICAALGLSALTASTAVAAPHASADGGADPTTPPPPPPDTGQPAPPPGQGGGSAPGQSPTITAAHPTVPGYTAKLKNGIAYAPALAPPQVQKAIWAANRLRSKPYLYGGGHGSFRSAGYDCSGTVSYALHAGGLLAVPMDSSDFMSWGQSGVGQWITVYTNPGHAFAYIAGLRLDTSGPGQPGPRWRTHLRPSTRGYSARHPLGF